MKLFILAAVLLIVSRCELKVYYPSTLSDQFTNGIKYSLANFGHIPYGRTLIGPLKLSDPIDACSPISSYSSDGKEKESPFLLIKRGNCTFVTKVKYAQLSGVKVAVIMDDREENSQDITMMDDGYSYSLRIPSIFIPKIEGEKLISFLLSPNNQNNNIVLTITFDVPKTSDIHYSFWLSTSNRNSFKLIRDFEPYYRKIAEESKFVPHYNIWTDEICARSNFTISAPDTCISGGRYCSIDPDGRGPATGAQVVLEDLRQICIHKTQPDLWWNYMIRFDNECLEIQVADECSTKIMENLNIDKSKIDKCFEGSFIKNAPNEKLDYFIHDNIILKNESRTIRQMGIQFWPSITINNISYKGNVEGRNVFEAVCSSFPSDKIPGNCNEVLGLQANEGEGLNVTLIMIIVISCLILFFIFLVFIYKKWVRTQITNEMSSQVNQMVTQYIAFYETREKKTKEDRF